MTPTPYFPEITADGSISMRHPVFGECFHAKGGALTESQSLYINGSRFLAEPCAKPAISVLDIGLGLGYNACATIARWWQEAFPPNLCLFSFEKEAPLVEELAHRQGAWQQNWNFEWQGWCAQLKKTESDGWIAVLNHPCGKVSCTWRIFIGDLEAKEVFASIPSQSIDFIWHDPFSIKHNPALWGSDFFRKYNRISHPQTLLMTYSVARPVKDALTDAGWVWKKFKGEGHKREWLSALPV